MYRYTSPCTFRMRCNEMLIITLQKYVGYITLLCNKDQIYFCFKWRKMFQLKHYIQHYIREFYGAVVCRTKNPDRDKTLILHDLKLRTKYWGNEYLSNSIYWRNTDGRMRKGRNAKYRYASTALLKYTRTYCMPIFNALQLRWTNQH